MSKNFLLIIARYSRRVVEKKEEKMAVLKPLKANAKKNRPKHTALLEKHLEKLLKLSTQMSLM